MTYFFSRPLFFNVVLSFLVCNLLKKSDRILFDFTNILRVGALTTCLNDTKAFAVGLQHKQRRGHIVSCQTTQKQHNRDASQCLASLPYLDALGTIQERLSANPAVRPKRWLSRLGNKKALSMTIKITLSDLIPLKTSIRDHGECGWNLKTDSFHRLRKNLIVGSFLGV